MGWQEIRERVQDIVLSLPGYRDYQERERRRDADKRVRLEIAQAFEAERNRLGALQTQAVNQGRLDVLDDLERSIQKLQRLTDRLRTASYGYAGWFMEPVIDERDLEQLIAFDRALAGGVERVREAVDAVAEALNQALSAASPVGGHPPEFMTAINTLNTVVDELNLRLDQRTQLLSKGKKLPPQELAKVLEAARPAATAFEKELAALRLNDAITVEDTDYLVTAQVAYSEDNRRWHACRLADGPEERWLRVEGEDVVLYEPVDLEVPQPVPDVLTLEDRTFKQVRAGTASATVEGPGGKRRGTIRYWLYRDPEHRWLWIEAWDDGLRVLQGEAVDPAFIRLWPRKRT